jgi:hypothetical protein
LSLKVISTIIYFQYSFKYNVSIRHPIPARLFGTRITVLETFNPGSGTGIHLFLKLENNSTVLLGLHYVVWAGLIGPCLADGIERKSS